MTGYTCIFEDGTEGRATKPGATRIDPVTRREVLIIPTFQFGSDPPIELTAALIDIHGRIINGTHRVVGVDSATDQGVEIRRGGDILRYEKCRGRNPIYLEPDGVASWVPVEIGPDGKPIYFNEVRYADKRDPTPARDYAHPYSPSNALQVWHGETVVVHQELDGWTLAESGLAPNGNTRILLRDPQGIVWIVWDTPYSFTSTPSQFALTPIGPIVAINNPNDGMSFFRAKANFKPWSPYVPPPVVVPPPEPEPEPTVPDWSAAPNPSTSVVITLPPTEPEPPPAPKPKPWWVKLIEELLRRWRP